MLALRLEHAGISLINNLSAVQDNNPVGICGGKRILPVHRNRLAERQELELAQGLDFAAGQCLNRANATSNLGCRDQLAKIRKTPAQTRKRVSTAIRKLNQLVRGGWRPDHPAQGYWVTARSIGKTGGWRLSTDHGGSR